jgi:N-acetylmuramic acid 6-phosphate etherase
MSTLFPTEHQNPATVAIDMVGIQEALILMNDQDQHVPFAVKQAIPAITALVEAAVPIMRAGGSLVYIGAGTSGRLAVLDAAECPPTFNTLPNQVQAVIAGGERAMVHAAEGAEDDGPAGRAALEAIIETATVKPFVIGLSASGSAAYVQQALLAAKQAGCLIGSMTCNAAGPLAHSLDPLTHVDYPIVVDVGPEVIAGSTRLKAGTAQKLVLNMISTIVMVQLGKTYSNWMIDVRPTNTKLRHRAIRLVAELGHVTETQAAQLLEQTAWQVKPAVVMAKKACTFEQAQHDLGQAQQKLRLVLEQSTVLS